MSDPKFTPGPWTAFDTGYQSDVDGWPHYSIGISEFETHAVVRPGCEEILENADLRANAHLIAAAPDLYDALVNMADDYEEYEYNQFTGKYDNPTFNPDILRRARSALAKARGET